MSNKSEMFQQLLTSRELTFGCGVYDALSAKIAEEAGFKGLWASGLSISAALGVRDSNEASWTQVLEVLEFMVDATTVPIMLDGDTGYGNFNNVRRLVKKLEQRGVAALCIEDKVFPKTNSFINGERQPLAQIEEFCSKIKAAKDTQQSPSFSLVARTEALITGWGMAEALRRAEAYHQAGADAIVIHSKAKGPEEVLAFKQEWGDRAPVIIIPTTYYQTPASVFHEAGFSMLIWANVLVRGAIRALQEAARQLLAELSMVGLEEKIVPLSEVFRLQNIEELQAAEDRYCPTAQPIDLLSWGEPSGTSPYQAPAAH